MAAKPRKDIGVDTLADLERALQGGRLPPPAQERATTLRDRLASPVRVTLLGLPQSGKSRVLDFLANAALVPEGAELPVLRVIAGDTPRTVVSLSDGRVKTVDGLDVSALAGLDRTCIELQVDLPALRRITLMEVPLGLDRDMQARACAQAAPLTDITIWCTRNYNPAEQAAWVEMPDALKDQAILLRTHIDLVPDARSILDRLDHLAGSEFERILGISTLNALDARKLNGDVDRDALRAAGGQELIATVLKMVERTRQALVDQADLLLAHNADLLDSAEADAPEVADVVDADTVIAAALATIAEDDAPSDPVVDPAPPVETPPASDPAVSEDVSTAAQPAAQPDRAPDFDPVSSPPEGGGLTAGTRMAFETAVAQLARTGADLIAGDAPPAKADILACADREMQWLDQHLADVPGDEPLLQTARDAAQEAVDMVQLMRIERSSDAAIDATALMIQMRRGLEQGLATL